MRRLILLIAIAWLIGPAYGGEKPTRRTQSVQERLESCNPSVALAAADEILGNPENLKEPLNLFMPAQVLFDHGRRDDAVFWFYAAQLRTRYQLAFERGDRPQLLSAMLMTVGTRINNYAFHDTSKFARTLDQVLAWDARTTNPFSERLSEQTRKQVQEIYVGLRGFRGNLLAQAEDLEKQANDAAPSIQKAYAEARSARATEPCER